MMQLPAPRFWRRLRRLARHRGGDVAASCRACHGGRAAPGAWPPLEQDEQQQQQQQHQPHQQHQQHQQQSHQEGTIGRFGSDAWHPPKGSLAAAGGASAGRSWRDLPGAAAAPAHRTSRPPHGPPVGGLCEAHGVGAKRAWLDVLRSDEASPDEARRALLELRSRGLLRTPKELTIVVRGLGRASLWAEAARVLVDARSSGAGADDILETATISACEKGSQWEAALTLLSGFLHKLQATSSSSSTHLRQTSGGRGNGWGGAAPAFNAAISACEKAKQWEWALALFVSMPDERLERDIVSFNAAISACEKGHQSALALALLAEATQRALTPNVITYSAAISACEKGHRWEWAVHLLEVMEDKNVTPQVIACSAAISACEKGEQWEHALALLERMRSRGPRPNVISFNAAMSACEKGRRWQVSLQLLDELWSGGGGAGGSSSSSSSGAARPLRPSTISANVAISACGRGSRWDAALRLLEVEMPARRLRPSSASFSAATNACGQATQWQVAVHIFAGARRAELADTVAFNTMLHAFSEGHAWPNALELFGSMLRGLGGAPRPDVLSFDSTMAACQRGFAWPRSLQLFELLTSDCTTHTARPSAISFAVAASACAQGALWEQALAWHEQVLIAEGSATISGFGAVVSAFAQARRWVDALCLTEQMKAHGFDPEDVLRTTLAPVLMDVGKQAWAAKFFQSKLALQPPLEALPPRAPRRGDRGRHPAPLQGSAPAPGSAATRRLPIAQLERPGLPPAPPPLPPPPP
eukprot:CAMPEP_0203902786 /NCGR_PEP_ID=MMETSP0359-20131031/44813_1 /ASSEMBLY_ACC=CAM_ASM_000338 /TAXON_ID=268821 /ORGANISM="Scrippsiella Hangoei, Strain SHTV-5" /LENGTH=760 /DNA_ID=CAMNT_0050826707 /DNA_START=42 /DNA_END=2321 /DNA_ORIENTATION=-